jgi:beta-1,4-mannosyl-glycoprotein beta-1,4-N-acetylglucosaminyltransferase
MIFDCFMFFNELDILEVRLNELYDVVDKFILVEATKTFTNQDKPLWFEQNKERFAAFADKIEHIIIDEYPEFDSAWTFENYQRDVIIKTLKERCQNDDIILISDLDEIPKANIVKKHLNTDGIKIFEQKLYTFYFNYLNATEPIWKKGTRMLKFSEIQDKTLTDIRMFDGVHLKDAGWHFTYLGGLDMVKYKIHSFAHQEYNNEYYMNDKRLQKLIQDGVDIFERGYKYKIVGIDDSFPKYVRENKEKFKKLILTKSSLLHRLKNKFSKSKRQDKRYIDTIKPINENVILDFISPSCEKVLEVSTSSSLKELVCQKFDIADYQTIKPLETDKAKGLPDNYFDCVLLDETITKMIDPEEFLINIRQKLNRNGFVIMTVPNFRYIKVLNQINHKKDFKYAENGILSKDNLRYFTRRSLFDMIGRVGYYLVTSKGLNPTKSIGYLLQNIFSFGNMYDCRHEKFLCVIKH